MKIARWTAPFWTSQKHSTGSHTTDYVKNCLTMELVALSCYGLNAIFSTDIKEMDLAATPLLYHLVYHSFDPFLFLCFVNDICLNVTSKIKLHAEISFRIVK